MKYYCDQSENSKLIVDRFIQSLDDADQLFLAGAKGSEFDALIKEYCDSNDIDLKSVVFIQPSMLDETVLGDLMVMLSRNGTNPLLIVIKTNERLDPVSEDKILNFVDNPAFHDSKFIVLMDGFDPFDDENTYPEGLAERSKESLFVLPPIHTRAADIAFFAKQLLRQYQEEKTPKTPVTLAKDSIDLMISYDWPGNYRELSDVLKTLVYGSSVGGVISRDRLEEAINLGRSKAL